MKNIIVKYKSLLVFFLVMNMCHVIHAQTAEIRTYGGEYFEEGRQIIPCSGGGYAIAGTTGSDEANNTNVYVVRLDDDLNCMWSRSIGGPQTEWGYSVVENENQELVICGFTSGTTGNGYDVLVIKLDQSGALIWQHTYGGSDWDFGYKIMQHPTGGYLIAGKTFSSGGGGSDGYLIQIAEDGTYQTEWTFGGVGDDELVDLEVLEDGFVLAGKMHLAETSIDRAWLVRMNSEMEPNWEYYSSQENSRGVDIAIANDSILFSYNFFSGAEEFDNGILQILNSEGEVVRESIDTGVGCRDQLVTSAQILSIGTTNNYGLGETAAVIFRRDHDGNWQNGAAFGTMYSEDVYSICSSPDGSICMIGKGNGYSFNGNFDLYLVKFQDDQIVSEYTLNIDNESCFSTPVQLVENNNPKIIYGRSGLMIEWNQNYFKVDIFDSSGRLVRNNFFASFQGQMSVAGLSGGIYSVVVTGEKERYSQKFSVEN